MRESTADPAIPAVLDRAADVIEHNGIARNDYYTEHPHKNPRTCPVCALGAIAIAAGFDPSAWEMADYQGGEFAPAVAAADALIDFLGLDPDKDYDETIGFWSDSLPPETVVSELRAAARVVASRG
ncbi:hypothetical protein ABZW11_17010 [Nonomuraea sp. NPDC004580]|uniref:DUF6197 family protein n=1 Tax=Nonomuraea sp. NPDC004580 TaxID=3154552 RepID=UPI0033B75A23